MSELDNVVKRIVVYPVNVGDTVFCICPGRKHIAEAKVKSISSHRRGMYTYFYLVAEYRNMKNEDVTLQAIFGITAFATQLEAEREMCGKSQVK